MQARPVLGERRLNAIYEDFVWLDDDTLVASIIPEGRGEAPTAPAVPVGPKISDNSSGSKSQARTYPDLLKVCTRIACLLGVGARCASLTSHPLATRCCPSPISNTRIPHTLP